jgi:putative peptidoglycan lipid II flippase
VAIAAFILAAGNVLSRLLGLVREQVIAALFGATAGTDAFVVAATIPQIAYDLLVGTVISSAFIPVFVDARVNRQRLAAVVRTVTTVVALGMSVIAVGIVVTAPLLIGLVARGFDDDRAAQAGAMLQVMAVAVVFQGVAGVLTAVLQAGNRFGPTALAAAAYNAGIIVCALVLHPALGVNSLVMGVVFGAALQFGLQLPALRGLDWRWSLDLASPDVRLIARLYLPVALGMVVTIVGIVIDRNLASGLAEGSLSVMNYATRIIQFPLGLAGTALASAVLPRLSAQAAAWVGAGAEQRAEARADYERTLRFGIRLILLLMLPATAVLVALREPLVQLLFERGRFDAADTARTALVFLAYAPQLPFTALDQLLIVAFYAQKDTRTPVAIGVVSVVLYLIAALSMVQPLGAAGLALANAIQNSAHGLILLGLMVRRGVRALDAGVARVAVVASVGAVASGVTAGAVGDVILGGVIAVPVYAAIVLGLRVPEASAFVGWSRRRLRFSNDQGEERM